MSITKAIEKKVELVKLRCWVGEKRDLVKARDILLQGLNLELLDENKLGNAFLEENWDILFPLPENKGLGEAKKFVEEFYKGEFPALPWIECLPGCKYHEDLLDDLKRFSLTKNDLDVLFGVGAVHAVENVVPEVKKKVMDHVDEKEEKESMEKEKKVRGQNLGKEIFVSLMADDEFKKELQVIVDDVLANPWEEKETKFIRGEEVVVAGNPSSIPKTHLARKLLFGSGVSGFSDWVTKKESFRWEELLEFGDRKLDSGVKVAELEKVVSTKIMSMVNAGRIVVTERKVRKDLGKSGKRTVFFKEQIEAEENMKKFEEYEKEKIIEEEKKKEEELKKEIEEKRKKVEEEQKELEKRRVEELDIKRMDQMEKMEIEKKVGEDFAKLKQIIGLEKKGYEFEEIKLSLEKNWGKWEEDKVQVEVKMVGVDKVPPPSKAKESLGVFKVKKVTKKLPKAGSDWSGVVIVNGKENQRKTLKGLYEGTVALGEDTIALKDVDFAGDGNWRDHFWFRVGEKRKQRGDDAFDSDTIIKKRKIE